VYKTNEFDDVEHAVATTVADTIVANIIVVVVIIVAVVGWFIHYWAKADDFSFSASAVYRIPSFISNPCSSNISSDDDAAKTSPRVRRYGVSELLRHAYHPRRRPTKNMTIEQMPAKTATGITAASTIFDFPSSDDTGCVPDVRPEVGSIGSSLF